MERMTTRTPRPAKVGRPRAVSDAEPDTSPRDQILRAAAGLFVEQGFGATSTRAIAEAVGIRQASLYYHFAGKDEILSELLETSVRPSVEVAQALLEEVGDDPAAAAATLYALALVDVRILATTPHNIGTLYLLPETQDPRYDGFRGERDRLQAIYGRLGAIVRGVGGPDAGRGSVAAPEESLLGAVLIQLVEVVIQLRRAAGSAAAGPGSPSAEVDGPAIAASCLRLLGLDEAAIARAAAAAAHLLPPV